MSSLADAVDSRTATDRSAGTDSRAASGRIGVSELVAEMPKVNILLVDDTPENLVALEAVLSELGQNLIKARSGEEALRLLLKQEFAVILLDVNMPGLNGFETAEMIRQRKSTEHIPIIFVSAISTSDTHLFKGYSLGAVDYIFTPVIAEVLRSKVTVFVELLKKTEEVRRQAEQLRQLEEREHTEKLKEAACRIELQTKQNRFFTLSVDLLAITDFAGAIKELNPSWQRVLGFSESELKSRAFWDRMDHEDRTRASAAAEKALNGQLAIDFETLYPCAQGGERCFSWTVAPYPAERLLYVFGRDITERRKNESEIRKLNNDLNQRANQLQTANDELEAEVTIRKRAEGALQESNSALEAFSYSVSHDLRAPIRAMQGFAKVLIEDYGEALDETGRECADRIIHAAERMDTLVNDLLIYSKLGHTTLQLNPISSLEIALESVAQVDPELKAKGAHVEIVEPMPVVMAHGTTLTQIFVNLISNGIKFVGREAQPIVRISSQIDDGYATISFQDNGIGIAPENQARIFRVFERLHSADDYPGTGLGLGIVRKGVERMGGTAGVDSELGKGSRFWIKLSLSPADARTA
jgi:PAS domain S-box-containing protein